MQEDSNFKVEKVEKNFGVIIEAEEKDDTDVV